MSSKPSTVRDLILKGVSRSFIDSMSDIVKERPELVNELWEVYFAVEEPVSRKAAWIIDTISEKKSEWVEPYLAVLISKLPLFNHDGLKRHGLRMISRVAFPEGCEGLLMDIAFQWLISPTESVAVKMYCMLVLYRLSATEPDILQELYDTIEFQLPDGTPGFRGIGTKMMQQIDRDMVKHKLKNGK